MGNDLLDSESKMKTIEKLADYEHVKNMLSSDDSLIQNMSEVLSLLSKVDALQIFVLSKDGLKSELDTPQKIGLTKKQYYTRLKQLYDLNLITKKSDAYIHTSLGDLIYNRHIKGLLQTMSNIKEIEMLDVLKRSSKFNDAEISKFLTKLDPKHSELSNAGSRATVEHSFDAMVSKVLETIEFAQHEILIASRFSNDLIINSVLKKSSMGVKVRILADTNTVRGFFKTDGKTVGKKDKNESERIQVVANPFYPSNIERQYAHTPFSLLIVDGKSIGMEIVDNYNPDKFLMSIHTEDENLAEQIRAMFNNWWKESSPNTPQPVERVAGKISTKSV